MTSFFFSTFFTFSALSGFFVSSSSTTGFPRVDRRERFSAGGAGDSVTFGFGNWAVGLGDAFGDDLGEIEIEFGRGRF